MKSYKIYAISNGFNIEIYNGDNIINLNIKDKDRLFDLIFILEENEFIDKTEEENK